MEKDPRFLTTTQRWKDIKEELCEDCENFLIDTLQSEENNEIVFEDDDDYWTSVTYDGGNHPDFAANPYSVVKRVYLKDHCVFLDIEDDDEYSISRISTEELCSVASLVYDLLSDRENNDSEES